MGKKIKFAGKYCTIEYEAVETGHKEIDDGKIIEITKKLCMDLDSDLNILHSIKEFTNNKEMAATMVTAFCEIKSAGTMAKVLMTTQLIQEAVKCKNAAEQCAICDQKTCAGSIAPNSLLGQAAMNNCRRIKDGLKGKKTEFD